MTITGKQMWKRRRIGYRFVINCLYVCLSRKTAFIIKYSQNFLIIN